MRNCARKRILKKTSGLSSSGRFTTKPYAKDTAYYWHKEDDSLAALIDQVDKEQDFRALGQAAKDNMKEDYTWEKIVGEYEELFLS